MLNLAIILSSWLIVYLGTRKRGSSSRTYTKNQEYHPIKTLEDKLDNRGYEPYDGRIDYSNGHYFTIIFGDGVLAKYIAASSIEELQQKADPILIEKREAWLKRKARKKRRKQSS